MTGDSHPRPSARLPRPLAAALLALLFVAGALGAQQPPNFGEETSVTVVEVPVEVSRDGVPVVGLTAADFEVREGGRPLPIVGFEAVELRTAATAVTTATPMPAAAPPLAARRHVLLLFDIAFTRRERLHDGVAAARAFLATGLDPADLVAVATYVPRGELALLLSFSSDRAAASRVLDAIAAAAAAEDGGAELGGDDPLRLTGAGARGLIAKSWPLDERNIPNEALLSLGPPDGTTGSFLQQNDLAHAARIEQPNVDERMRGHVRAFNDTVHGLATALRDVQGRKYLALFSEGFAGRLLTDGPKGATDPSFGGSNVLRPLAATLEELRRSGWVVHAVDLAGLHRGGLSADGLFYLAHETGGTLIEGTNDLAKGLGQALQASAHVYVLTVQPADVVADGAYHPLEVRLRGSTRDVQVRHRRGYYAPLPFGERSAVRRRAEAAMLVTGGEPRDELGIAAAAIPLGGGEGARRFGVVVEVPGTALRRGAAGHPGLEAYGYALDAAGNSSDFFSYAVDLDPQKLAVPLERGGVRFVAELDLPPGPHHLRLLVRERGEGRASLLTLPVGATAAAAPEEAALFLPGSDLSNVEPWLVVREPGTSFELHGRALSPALHAAVPAGSEVPVVFVSHGLAGRRDALSARILDAHGHAARGGTLELLSFTPGSNGEADMLLGKLRVGTLQAGDYRLELVVAAAGAARRSVVGRFRVVPPPAS